MSKWRHDEAQSDKKREQDTYRAYRDFVGSDVYKHQTAEAGSQRQAPLMTRESHPPIKRMFSDEDQDEDTLQRSNKRKRDLDRLLSQIQKEPGADRMRSTGNITPTYGSRTSESPSTVPHSGNNEISTNLHIGNIHSSVTEHDLCLHFGVFGPIASIKIMYPRGLQESLRGRNNGFVAFMQRAAAQRALQAMNGKPIQGLAIHAEWGRPIPLPSHPVFVLEDHTKRPSRPTGAGRANVPPPSSLRAETALRQVQILIPEDESTRERIHGVADRVVRNGPSFEEFITERERLNPQFDFVHRPGPQNTYYSWKKESLERGDTLGKWARESIKKAQLGVEWLAPAAIGDQNTEEATSSDADSDEEDAKERHRLPGQLGPIAKARFKKRLELLNGERGFIAKCMCMAIDHADACDAVVDLFVSEITKSDPDDVSLAALQKALARLHVISDVLHNSGLSIPNVWKYRAAFELKLRSVFVHVNKIYRKIDSRMGAEIFRRQVDNLLNIWETWMCFTTVYIDELRAVLERAMDEEQHIRMERLRAAEESAERAWAVKEQERLEREKGQRLAQKWKTIL